jgi:hypothetical protein
MTHRSRARLLAGNAALVAVGRGIIVLWQPGA